MPRMPTSDPGAVQLYIYWKLPACEQAAAQAAVHGFQQALRRRHPGLHAALYLRQGETDASADATATLMEVYDAGGPLSEALAAELAQPHVLAPWCRNGRHVERFIPLPPTLTPESTA